MMYSLTVGVRFLESVPCVNKTGGTVVFVLELHVETSCLAESITSSWRDKEERGERGGGDQPKHKAHIPGYFAFRLHST